MTIQSSGAIYLSNLQTEFGGANPIYMSEYYKGGTYVNAQATNPNGIPTSGAIDLQDFYGSAQYVAPTVRAISGSLLSSSLGDFFGPNKSYSAAVTQSYYGGAGSTFHVVVNPTTSTIIQMAFNGFGSIAQANTFAAGMNGDTFQRVIAGAHVREPNTRGTWAVGDQPEPGIYVYTNNAITGPDSGVAGNGWSLTFGP
jgi:hypothetical protein